METEEQMENQKGNTSLVKKFCSSCFLPTLVALASETYPKEISNRLSGSEIKEALLIAILGHIRTNTPEKEPPKWIPADLVASTAEDLLDRLNYLKLFV